MIVVDTNIVAYLALPGPYSDAVRALRQREPDWSAPVSWRSEFRNVLAGYLRRGILDLTQVCELQREAESLIRDLVPVNTEMVMELVSASTCTAYDCEFVALALDLEVPLITADRGVIDAFPRIAVSLSD